MIQDISPYEFHNEYTDRAPLPEDTVFVFDGKSVLCCEDGHGSLRFPLISDLTGENTPESDKSGSVLRYLFRISSKSYFLLLHKEPDADAIEIQGYSYKPLWEIIDVEYPVADFAVTTAFHLFTWYDKNRFCGRCGSSVMLEHDKQERMLRCPSCGNMVFPTIAPAVIIGVTWGEKILMTKYAGRDYEGWALIAGFCEIGETVEDTVHREAMEEAGVRVTNLRYVGSQPWGSDSNVLMGFFCDVDGDPEIHMDAEELARAQWVDRSDVPDIHDNISLTGHLIELFRKGENTNI